MSATHLLRVTTGYGDFAETALVRTTAAEADAGARVLTRLVGGVEHLVLADFDAAAAGAGGIAVYRNLAGFRRAFSAEANAPGFVSDDALADILPRNPDPAYFNMIWDGGPSLGGR